MIKTLDYDIIDHEAVEIKMENTNIWFNEENPECFNITLSRGEMRKLISFLVDVFFEMTCKPITY